MGVKLRHDILSFDCLIVDVCVFMNPLLVELSPGVVVLCVEEADITHTAKFHEL